MQVGLAATALAAVLGTLAAVRARALRLLRQRTSISFLVMLPIALPGIVTGMALNATFADPRRASALAIWTVVVAHVTFCIVVVFNNVVARLRGQPRSRRRAPTGAVPARVPRHHVPADALGADRGRACSPSR